MRPAASWPPERSRGPASPADRVLAARLTAQLLAGRPARDPVTVTERLLAVQAQDPRGARLAIRARTRGLRAADVDRELTERRSLLITWLNRGTLHLVTAEDYAWLHVLTTPPLLTSSDTRLRQNGLSASQIAKGLSVIEGALVEDGPQTRAQLKDRLERAGVPIADTAHVHLMFRASLEGVCVRGPMVSRQHAYVLARDWLAPARPVQRSVALAELARRYLAGHGPADDRDLARWAGLPLRDARAGLEAIAPELVQRTDGLLQLRSARRRPAPLPPPRLLGTFEPTLLGWRSREALLGDDPQVIVNGGMFSQFAIVAGRGVAGWRLRDGQLEIKPWAPISDDDLAALKRDGAAVQEFLGLA
jgi:hypothetical protein